MCDLRAYLLCERDACGCEAGFVHCLQAHFISVVSNSTISIIAVCLRNVLAQSCVCEVNCTYNVSFVSWSSARAEV